VARATQEIGAVLASPDVAQALEVEVGSALVALTRVIFDENGRGIEHLFALYRPDRYALRMDLVRAEGANGKRWVPANDAVAVPHGQVHNQRRSKRNGRAK
jgi:GntR family transcriptional regulator